MQLRSAADAAAAASAQASQQCAELRAAADAAITEKKLLERQIAVIAQVRLGCCVAA